MDVDYFLMFYLLRGNGTQVLILLLFLHLKNKKQSFSLELISFYKSTCTHTQAYMHTSLVVSHQTLYPGCQSTHYMTSAFLSDSISYHSPHASLFRCSNRSSSFLPLNILAFPGNCLPDTLPFRIQLQCHLSKTASREHQAHPG